MGATQLTRALTHPVQQAFADPMMRSHPSNGQDKVPQPYSTPELLDATRRLTKLHVALKAYKRGLLEASKTSGIPMSRHTLFCCAIDKVDSAVFEQLASQLMVGENLAIVPVLAKGKASVTALVPPDCDCALGESKKRTAGTAVWHSIWNANVTFAPGERVTLDAPIGKPAVLVRQGSEVAQALLAAIDGGL